MDVFEDPDVCMQVASFLGVSSLGRLACTAARFSAVLRMCVTPAITCLQAAVRRRLKAPSIFEGAKFYSLPDPDPIGSESGSQWSEGCGSARSSEGEDHATWCCDGDSCEYQGTFAEVLEHENQCTQMTGELGL